MTPVERRSGNQYLLFDADAGLSVQSGWFDPQELHRTGAVNETLGGGRGMALAFTREGGDYVLRHYRRGGYVARWVDDLYFWSGLERTRAWREWQLLVRLAELGLPAPAPVAARVVRAGLGYRADLITRRLAAVTPLLTILMAEPLDHGVWSAIGTVVRRFHDADVYHPDLTANNILLDAGGGIYLVDFDKAAIRAPGSYWKQRNVDRLYRGLSKQHALHRAMHFGDAEWSALVAGYEGTDKNK